MINKHYFQRFLPSVILQMVTCHKTTKCRISHRMVPCWCHLPRLLPWHVKMRANPSRICWRSSRRRLTRKSRVKRDLRATKASLLLHNRVVPASRTPVWPGLPTNCGYLTLYTSRYSYFYSLFLPGFVWKLNNFFFFNCVAIAQTRRSISSSSISSYPFLPSITKIEHLFVMNCSS